MQCSCSWGEWVSPPQCWHVEGELRVCCVLARFRPAGCGAAASSGSVPGLLVLWFLVMPGSAACTLVVLALGGALQGFPAGGA
eukprot:11074641-Alexandrium_andersonii.AAC.1